MAKPDLLILGSTLPRAVGDATPSFVLDLAKGQQREFSVTVLAPRIPNSAAEESLDGVKVVRYRYWPLKQRLADGAILDNLKKHPALWLEVPFLLIGLFLAIRRQKPTLIHAHWIFPQALIARLAAPRAKLMVTTHGGDIYALNQQPLRAMKRWVLSGSSIVTTVNSQMRDQLTSWGISEDKVHVLPMGVDIKKGSSLNLNRKANTVALVGRLVEKKGVDYLLDAVATGINQSRLPKDFQLIIAGDGPDRKNLEQKAIGLPVSFLGEQSKQQVRELFSTSRVAILPSITAKNGDQEGLPVTLLEAAAAGAFIIASDLPGINEVIRHRETGLLTPQRDSAAILDALELALSESADDQKLVQGCVAMLSKEIIAFDHDAVSAKYNQLLKTLK